MVSALRPRCVGLRSLWRADSTGYLLCSKTIRCPSGGTVASPGAEARLVKVYQANPISFDHVFTSLSLPCSSGCPCDSVLGNESQRRSLGVSGEYFPLLHKKNTPKKEPLFSLPPLFAVMQGDLYIYILHIYICNIIYIYI